MKIRFTDMRPFENKTETTVTVEEGRAAILDLPPIDSFPEPDVTWQTDGNPVPYSQKYAKSNANQLIILSTDMSDVKAYRWVHQVLVSTSRICIVTPLESRRYKFIRNGRLQQTHRRKTVATRKLNFIFNINHNY